MVTERIPSFCCLPAWRLVGPVADQLVRQHRTRHRSRPNGIQTHQTRAPEECSGEYWWMQWWRGQGRNGGAVDVRAATGGVAGWLRNPSADHVVVSASRCPSLVLPLACLALSISPPWDIYTHLAQCWCLVDFISCRIGSQISLTCSLPTICICMFCTREGGSWCVYPKISFAYVMREYVFLLWGKNESVRNKDKYSSSSVRYLVRSPMS